MLLGQIAQRHPRYSDIRALAAALAAITGATLGYLSEGANSVGAALAGALPHRGAGGKALSRAGRDAQAMIDSPRQAYVLFGIEPGQDLANGARALDALRGAQGRLLHAVRRAPSCSTSPTCSCRSAPSPRPRARS